MSLRGVHIVFITASILLCVVFGGWCVSQYMKSDSTGHLVAAIAAFSSGLGLVVYGEWFLRKMRRSGVVRDIREGKP